MYGGQRLKRSCFASNNSCVTLNGVFDTSLEAECTPALAQALASVMIEGICQSLHVTNAHVHSKKMKLSHFQSLASQKQPSRNVALPVVPQFSCILACRNFPQGFSFDINDGATATCVSIIQDSHTIVIPCGSKLLRKTTVKGGENRLTKISIERTMSLQIFGDVSDFLLPSTFSGSTPEVCDKCNSTLVD